MSSPLRATLCAAVLSLSAAGMLASTVAAAPSAVQMKPDAALQAAVASPARPAADRARDVYRHPYESLVFWGVKPGMTVIDLDPGGGYWTQILAPYFAQVGGVYVAGLADLNDPKTSDGARKGRARFEAKYADPAQFGHIRSTGFGPASGPLAPAGSVDIIMSTREIHNWIPDGWVDKAMADCFRALKPGGILAVEDHRADPKPQKDKLSDGYVSVASVVEAATRAGFRLESSSEINANPKDTKDYPFGVWTLPPTRESTPDGRTTDPTFDHTRYDAIGESDRMTLRFRKPA